MEHNKIDTWNLPEDPYERQEKVAQLADELCDRFDKIFYELANKALNEVRNQIRMQDSQNNPTQEE